MFDCDPMTNPDAVLHRMLSYGDVRMEQLRVMDETAITLCKENDMPVVVFNLTTPGNILRAVTGDVSVGTTVCHMKVCLDCRKPSILWQWILIEKHTFWKIIQRCMEHLILNQGLTRQGEVMFW